MRTLYTFVAFILLQTLAPAGIMPGTRYVNHGGEVVTFYARGTIFGDVRARVTDNLGTSASVPGTPTQGGCSGETVATDDMTTHGTDDDGNPTGETNEYRAVNDKLQQKDENGNYVTLRKAHGPQPNPCENAPVVGGGDTIGGQPVALPGDRT